MSRSGVDTFVQYPCTELRTGGYRPSAVRRVLIPKPGQPGNFRPLDITRGERWTNFAG
ncbi:MAG: hypothetical protein MUF54_01680 [Polyangiaceae bacterium]|nr:hypothetical protein [Polyangiaceae bacterium]